MIGKTFGERLVDEANRAAFWDWVRTILYAALAVTATVSLAVIAWKL